MTVVSVLRLIGSIAIGAACGVAFYFFKNKR